MISRTLSAVIAIAYIATAYFTDGGETAFRAGMFLILPIACIWFGDSMGGYVGGTMRGQYISSSTPGCLVVAGGWLLLILPAAIGLISFIRSPG
jgi:hypothetical protein